MDRRLVVAVVAVFAALLGAAPAYATSVTGLSVDNASPTQAEGAQTVYKVTFKTTAAVAAPGSITIGFPTGTGFAGYNGSSIDVGGSSVGTCGGADAQFTVSCGLFTGQAIAAGASVTVTLNGVANTATAGAPRTLIVTTTGDTDAASAPVTTVAAHGVSGVTVDNTSPTTAAGGQTIYKVAFSTSATGALARAANSAITLTFPTGTTFDGYNGSSIDVGGTSVGNCGGASGLVITCGLFSGQSIAASAPVTISLDGITNPAAGTPVVTVSTTSDPPTVRSSPFTVVAANPVTGVTVDNTAPTTAAGGQTIYAIGFTASATGGLSRAANSAITLAFPSGTTFAGYNGSSVVDTTAGSTSIGNCGGASGLVITCGLFSGQAIPAGHKVAITLNGISNPGAGNPSVSVSTTSDPAVTASAPFTVVAANPLTAVTADNTTPTTAAGGQTVYAIGFTASATGAFSRAANSIVTLVFAAGTTFAGYNGSSLVDTTAGSGSIGNCGGAAIATRTITCSLFSGQSVAAGHHVVITLNGITNPGAGSPTVSVSTTSDPAAVPSAPFSVVAAHPLTRVGVTVGSTAAGATTPYAVAFTTSATGALSRAANSAITLAFPAGTTFASQGNSSVVDASVGTAAIGNCGGAVLSSRTVSCGLFTGQSIPPGHVVVVNIAGITNPAGAGPYTLNVSTTSDPQAVTSTAYATLGAPAFSAPSDHSAQSSHTVVLRGTGQPAATLTVSDGPTAQPATTVADDGTWALTLDSVPEGTHAYTATQRDTAGNVSPTSPTLTVIVDSTPPAPPQITSPADNTTVTSGTFTLSGSAEPGATVRVSEGDTPAGSATASGSGAWSLTLSGVADGAYRYTATARDAAGNASGVSNVVHVVVSIPQPPPVATITAGPAGVTTDAAPAFTFGSSGGAVTFECRLDGPGGTGTFETCVSPKTYSGLQPGQYTFFVRSVDATGNQSADPASRSFTVSSPQQATPTPTPTPTPSPTATPTPTPTPVPGQTVVAQAVKGTVRVKLPGTNTFVDLSGTQGIPVGATVDTRRGTVQLTALQTPGGKAGIATFFDGLFKLTQTRTTTDLTLNQPLAPCPRRGHASAAAKKPKTRKLWGSGHGSFRTRGVYSAATVRGTKWLVQDSCAGTLTKVAQGVVSVRDNVRRKTITLRAGKQYLARPKR